MTALSQSIKYMPLSHTGYYEEAGTNVQWFNAALESTVSHSRQHTVLHINGFWGTEWSLSSQKARRFFLKYLECAHVYTHTQRNSGLPPTAHHNRDTSVSANELPLFYDHSHGKTCYKLQFQIICITCSYQKFPALPCLMPQTIHAHLCTCV